MFELSSLPVKYKCKFKNTKVSNNRTVYIIIIDCDIVVKYIQSMNLINKERRFVTTVFELSNDCVSMTPSRQSHLAVT